MLPTDVPERFLVVVARGPPRLRPTHTLAQPRAVAPRRPSITAVRGTTASHALYRIAPLRPPPPLSHRSARRHVVQPQPPYHHVCHTHPPPGASTETHRQSAASPPHPAARPRMTPSQPDRAPWGSQPRSRPHQIASSLISRPSVTRSARRLSCRRFRCLPPVPTPRAMRIP